MTTAMQFAFLQSKHVNQQTPLGRMILQVAARQVRAEDKRIRLVAANKAAQRIERENNALLQSFNFK